MGPAFVILFWLILAGIYSFVFLAFVGMWFFGKKRKIIWLKWLGGLPATGMAALALLVVSVVALGIICSMNPRWVFKETFNAVPPASVSKIQSSFYSFADSGDVYLRFQTSQEEFEKLASTNLVKKTAEEMKDDAPGEFDENIPKWWDYQIQSDWIYYLRISPQYGLGKRGFASETEYFAYNPKTQIAYYHFVGID